MDLTEILDIIGHGENTHRKFKAVLEDLTKAEKRVGVLKGILSNGKFAFKPGQGLNSRFHFEGDLVEAENSVQVIANEANKYRNSLLLELTPSEDPSQVWIREMCKDLLDSNFDKQDSDYDFPDYENQEYIAKKIRKAEMEILAISLRLHELKKIPESVAKGYDHYTSMVQFFKQTIWGVRLQALEKKVELLKSKEAFKEVEGMLEEERKEREEGTGEGGGGGD